MGTCFYLRRDDNRTLYDLGKGTGEWGEVFGCGNGGRSWIPLASTIDYMRDLSRRLCSTFGYGDHELPLSYFVDVAHDVRRWADGQLFSFVTDSGFEDWQFDESWDMDAAVTGDRHRKEI